MSSRRPRRIRLRADQFERIVERAIARIPEEIRRHLHNVVIAVEQRPEAELLAAMGLPPDETLFGVFQGEPLDEQSLIAPPLYPATILIFQQPLEAHCRSIDQLEAEIAVTVVHEVAHFFGIGEQRLRELGYG
jgi:predicted Zn-dependent protease with MMP-like domain